MRSARTSPITSSLDAGNYYFGTTRYQVHKGLGDVPFINGLAYMTSWGPAIPNFSVELVD